MGKVCCGVGGVAEARGKVNVRGMIWEGVDFIISSVFSFFYTEEAAQGQQQKSKEIKLANRFVYKRKVTGINVIVMDGMNRDFNVNGLV